MIKMPTILIITVFLLIIIVVTSCFWGFEEWKKQTYAGVWILSILNTLGVYIFAVFGILKLLGFIFPKLNKYIINNRKCGLVYNVLSCIILTLFIPLMISDISITTFFWHYSIISFVYLFGVETICVKIFS